MKTLAGSLAGAPTGVSSGSPSNLDVLAIVAGGAIRNWHFDGAAWSFRDLPAGPSIPPEGLCAVFSVPNTIDVFVASSTANTPWWWQWNGTSWLARGPLPPGGANLQPVPPAAVVSGPNNIDVFAAGAGNRPWWWH